uniref:KIAA2013 n=1 Tax=Latimeria chalumnae TaxID=7897 RepID=H3ACM7_LATCH
MWLQQRLKGLPGLLSSNWARRLLGVLVILLIVYWYLIPKSVFKLFSSYGVPRGATGGCLQTKTEQWRSLVEAGEAILLQSGNERSANPAVVGNGHVLLDVETNKLWVSSSLPGSFPIYGTEYPPLVVLKPAGLHSEAKASVIKFQDGLIRSVKCLQMGASKSPRDCVTVWEDFISHRTRPHLYLQKIHISNPSDKTAAFEITSPVPSFGTKFSSGIEKVEEKEFILSSGKVLTEKNEIVLVVVAAKKLVNQLQVAPKSEFAENMLSVVYTSEPIGKSKVEETFNKLKESVKKEMAELLRMGLEELFREHQQAWADLLISGIEMRKITDSHTPSSQTVNTTLYYMLSTSPAPLLDPKIIKEEQEKLVSTLNYADHCFSGHATMHAENLWPSRTTSTFQILTLFELWRLTLQKRGCKGLVMAGAHGMMQAMVLSFGGLQFTENHLQFQADPDVLHNSYSLRGIRYNTDLINLAVLLDSEGKPFLHVSVKPQEKPVKLFACEAGCMNEPVELTSEVKGHTFPVMVTQPITPLLYISTDLTHLQDLRHTLHLKAILAHEEHMAKQYPGLPFLFWFSVASLITLFHLFLFKLIYNEYCGPGAKPLFRSKEQRSA